MSSLLSSLLSLSLSLSLSLYLSTGTIPKEGCFAIHALLGNHYFHGASYPRGGSSEIALHIIPVIEKPGGKVLVRATVKQILIDEESGKVAGTIKI